ncbi:MAG TPA: flagellar FliJ family protein [Chloroflexota bacterium]|nr:flagellar FliJ family protein [Chloroflexota bacterium]
MSKKFTFSLDAALRQRTREEQTAQMAYAHAAQSRQAARAALDALRARAVEGGHEATRSGAPMDMVGRMQQLLYLDQADLQVRRQEQVVAQQEAVVTQAQQALLHAATRRRALERLRERRLEEYTVADQTHAEKELDERTTMRYVRVKV